MGHVMDQNVGLQERRRDVEGGVGVQEERDIRSWDMR